MNVITLGAMSVLGILLQTYLSASNLTNKVDQFKFANTSYEKVLTQLRNYLRGVQYVKTFLSDVKVVDNIITDTCPALGKTSRKYEKIYTSI